MDGGGGHVSITIERGPATLLAGAVIVAGIAVGAGAFLGGYALGDEPAPPAPTELAEKVYTEADLEAALATCELDGAEVVDSSVTLLGADYPGVNRQCFVAEMGATELADREFTTVIGANQPEEGEYAWSNVRMSWKQTDEGRDVTITVE